MEEVGGRMELAKDVVDIENYIHFYIGNSKYIMDDEEYLALLNSLDLDSYPIEVTSDGYVRQEIIITTDEKRYEIIATRKAGTILEDFLRADRR
jgi:hypothetical protein